MRPSDKIIENKEAFPFYCIKFLKGIICILYLSCTKEIDSDNGSTKN